MQFDRRSEIQMIDWQGFCSISASLCDHYQ